ncbi:hypothetical protein D3C87_1986110 [compost metagenome]
MDNLYHTFYGDATFKFKDGNIVRLYTAIQQLLHAHIFQGGINAAQFAYRR